MAEHLDMFSGSVSAQNDRVKGKQYVYTHAYYVVPILTALFDYVAVVLAEWLAYGAGSAVNVYVAASYAVPGSYEYIYVPAFALFVLLAMGSYQRMRPAANIYKSIVKGVAVSVVLMMALVELFGVTSVVPRAFFVLFTVLLLIMVLMLRTAGMLLAKRCRVLHTPVLLIGAGLTAERLVRFFEEDWGYCYEVVGFLDDAPKSHNLAGKYEVLGTFDEAAEILQSTGVENVIIAAPGLSREKLVDLVARIRPYARTLALVPDLIGTPFGSVDIDMIFSEEMLLLKSRNNLAVRRNRIIKRGFDLVCGTCIAVLSMPIICLTALAIKLDSAGSVFFNAKRIGRKGKPFTCYKFRSMYQNADEILARHLEGSVEAQEEWRKYAKLRGRDPRVTRVGRFIRRTSIDELPQIFNVLLGDMSLVGPRPYLPRERKTMGESYDVIVQIMPGMTGYWQVCGRNGVTFADRLRMDVWYVRNWSVWMDIMYLAKTVGVVQRKTGAY